MKAVALFKYLPIENPQSLVDVELPMPTPGETDLLVETRAIAVNPVDTKIRAPKDKVETAPKVLGWDSSGVVKEIGSQVKKFKVGDEVFYSGDVGRAGSNSEFHVVDAALVGFKPKTLSFSQAAALPLTSITAYEALFDRMGIDITGNYSNKKLLIIGGAGGVGSIAIQLAALVNGLQIVATASRPETSKWVMNLGAAEVIDHHELRAGKLQGRENSFDYIFCTQDTDDYFDILTTLVAPQGAICSIVEISAKITCPSSSQAFRNS